MEKQFISTEDHRYHEKSRIIKIRNKKLAIGLHWFVQENSDKYYLGHQAERLTASFGIKYSSNNNITVFGLFAGKNVNNKVYAAAPMLALKISDGIIVHRLDKDTYWLIAITNKQPIKGRDLIVNGESAMVIIRHIQGVHNLPLYGDQDFFARWLPQEKPTPININTLISEDLFNKNWQLKRIRHKYITWLPWLLIGAALIVLLKTTVPSVTKFISQPITYLTKRKTDENEKALAQRLNKKLAVSFNNLHKGHPTERWLSYVLTSIDKVPLEAGGWFFKKFTCKAEQPTCSILWQSSGFGTYKTLQKSTGAIGPLKLLSHNEVEQHINIHYKPKPPAALEHTLEKINNLPSIKTFKMEHISTLQALGYISTLKYNVTSGKPALTIQENIPKNKISLFDIGSWKIQGAGLPVLIDTVLKIEPNSFLANKITINIDYKEENIYSQWTIEGSYATKN